MPDETPALALPYPLPEDALVDYPATGRDLAETLELMLGPLVTELPPTPVDGQVIRFLADAANGVVWTLRFNAAAAPALPWEFVGGSPLMALAPNGNAYGVGWNNIGGVLYPPLTGDYLAAGQASGLAHASTTQLMHIGIGVNATDNANPVLAQVTGWAAQYYCMSGIGKLAAVAAGATLWLNGATSSVGGPAPSYCQWTLTPIRVGPPGAEQKPTEPIEGPAPKA